MVLACLFFSLFLLAGFSRVTLLGSAGGPAIQLIYLEFTFPPNKNLDNHKILTDKRKGKKAFVRWKMFNWLAKGKKTRNDFFTGSETATYDRYMAEQFLRNLSRRLRHPPSPTDNDFQGNDFEENIFYLLFCFILASENLFEIFHNFQSHIF